MQSLSEIIQPEDNNYRPPHIKYDTPAGFDLMDIMAFAEHGQPYAYFHTLREKPRWLGGSHLRRQMLPVSGRCRVMRM